MTSRAEYYSVCFCRRPPLLVLLLLLLPLLWRRRCFYHCACLPNMCVLLYCCCDFPHTRYISLLEPPPRYPVSHIFPFSFAKLQTVKTFFYLWTCRLAVCQRRGRVTDRGEKIEKTENTESTNSYRGSSCYIRTRVPVVSST